ncbi:MAG: putative zinc-binding peptidase [Pirellulales bacterium]|nr:putative zinc-binding peptidase [Pirellulales bacterium]
MRTFVCQCGRPLFFENSLCLNCQREVGFCPVCSRIAALVPEHDGHYLCGNPACGARLVKCANYVEYSVCNRCCRADAPGATTLCDCCRFNHTIPDLQVPGNLQKWYRLEAAKRRLFYELDQLQLPYGTEADGFTPALSFAFMADLLPNQHWQTLTADTQVFTGHEGGRITINIREADDVEREKARVNLGEKKRTLIGHFRHEIGHYYWDLLVKDHRETESRAVFGDHTSPDYATAMDAYYQNGPPADWQDRHISAYATMHPWEDFAETWTGYLSMISALDTAAHLRLCGKFNPLRTRTKTLVRRYQQLGLAINEVNRSAGLLDAAPEIISPGVVKKLDLIRLLIESGRRTAAPTAS